MSKSETGILRQGSKLATGHRWIIPAGIILLGLVLRLYHINNQSVWQDEAFSITVSGQPLSQMTPVLVRDAVHPPLHYYLLHFWFDLFGYGALQARLLSALWGTLSIAVIYMLGTMLFGRNTGILAALLLAVSQLGVAYSQEARPYAQLLFFSLCTVYLFVLALRSKNIWIWWGFTASSAFMIYTHYYGAFVLLGLGIIAVLKKSRYSVPFSWWASASFVTALLYTPWLLSGIAARFLSFTKTSPWNPQTHSFLAGPTIYVNWFSFVTAINQFNNGKIRGFQASSPWWSLLVGGVLFTIPALIALKPIYRGVAIHEAEQWDRANIMLLAILWILPIALIQGLGLLGVLYSIRFVVLCIAPYYILVASGMSRIYPRLRSLMIALVIVYSLSALRSNYLFAYKEDLRGGVDYLASAYRGGDCCIFWPGKTMTHPPRYWFVYHRDYPKLRVMPVDDILSGQGCCNRVWLIWDRTPWLNPDTMRMKLEDKRKLEAIYTHVEKRKYSKMEVNLYTHKVN